MTYNLTTKMTNSKCTFEAMPLLSAQ
jgi:hypothetical protein